VIHARVIDVRNQAQFTCEALPCFSHVCGSVPETCLDGTLSGDETDVDCGGSCQGCPDGDGCSVGGDCQSKVCGAGLCTPAACDDGVPNGDEEGTDCGGSCTLPCAVECNAFTYQAENVSHTTGGNFLGGWALWGNGSVFTDHDFTPGQKVVSVRAQGQSAAGVWAHMVVRVGGAQIGAVYVAPGFFTNYNFPFTA
jgi:hypothetical protein